MLYSLSGKLVVKKPDFAAIVAIGVGFKFSISKRTFRALPKIGAKTRVFCYLNISQNGAEIYGFADKKELELFELLNSINSIGPKSAINILGNVKPEKFMSVVASGKPDLISDAWGIGRKKAERIVMELKDKIKKIGKEMDVAELEAEKDIKYILKNLGYKQREIEETLDKLPSDVKKINDRVKYALKFLGKR